MNSFFKNFGSQLPSGLVVFLVALPLCLSVGLVSTNVLFADGTTYSNIFSGIISGIIGGVVIGFLSGSRYGVSGPAAGLITIVAAAIVTLGSFEAFLVAVFLSGIIQLIAGFLKAGIIGAYFPSSVIKGMLAAIGIILILKEIPHLIGDDKDFLGDLNFAQKDGLNTFTELGYSLFHMDKGPVIVGLASLTIIIIFTRLKLEKFKLFKFIPSALIVVVFGIVLNEIFKLFVPNLVIQPKHLVNLPVAKSLGDFPNIFTFPDFSALSNYQVYVVAITIAIIGSLETLLSAEATDKLSKSVHGTPANRELKAQGVGNMLAGLVGGLPITQVIVRSSANINAGAKNKTSTIIHGFILLISALSIPFVLNKIPLASLAAILMVIGYKLTKVGLFIDMKKLGITQFLPFIVTIITILFTDLLIGIGVGSAVALFFILKNNFQNNFVVKKDDNEVVIVLSEEVSFLNKGGLRTKLNNLKEGTTVLIDGSNCKNIDYDVLELISDYKNPNNERLIVKTINIPEPI